MPPTDDERRLDALTERQDDELVAVEKAALVAVTASLNAELQKLTRAATAMIDGRRAVGPDESKVSRYLLTRLSTRLINLKPKVQRPFTAWMLRALDLGVRQGFEQLGASRTTLKPALPPELFALAETTELNAKTELIAGSRIVTAATSADEVVDGLARARRAVTRTEAAVAWGVGRSAAYGVGAVAEATGSERLWVGERDACVHCLAYFGEIAAPGVAFPSGLTFGTKPLPGPVPAPPLHPHCRCRIVVWQGSWAGEIGRERDDYPAALKREARRSIARGWSLPTESNRARLDAAERLLRRGTGLPASVDAYTRRALREGKFPRGRMFPG